MSFSLAARVNSLTATTSDILLSLPSYAPTSNPAFTGTVTGITPAMVGLGSVDNASDLNKPISTATQTALNTCQPALSASLLLSLNTTTNLLSIDLSNYSTQGNLSTAIANLVSQAPANLDTLKELAAALGNDPNYATNTATLLGAQQAIITATSFLSVPRVAGASLTRFAMAVARLACVE